MLEGELFSRRAFLKGGSLFLAGSLLPKALASFDPPEVLKIGLMTDIHYADINPRGTRIYRDSMPKMKQAVDSLIQYQADMLVELGDLIDSPSRSTKDIDLQTLATIDAEFARFGQRRHYVLGNHCLWKLSKREFLKGLNRPPISFYSFNRRGWHFVVLDGCNRADGAPYCGGNFMWTDADIPRYQAEWLKYDLKQNNLPTMVFVHQRLDLDPPSPYGVRSAPMIRSILENSRDVVAVFQGHSHFNEYREIEGIHYVTLGAMVEGAGLDHNGWSLVHAGGDGSLKIEGFATHRTNGACNRRLVCETLSLL